MLGLTTALAAIALTASAASAQNCLTCPGGGGGGGTPPPGSHPPKPTTSIASFSPTFGWAGDTVAVQGSGFTGATQVTLGGVAAQFKVQDDGDLTLTVPAAATDGPITVTSPLGTATSSSNYTISPDLAGYNSQGISAGCTTGNMNTTATLYRDTGLVSGRTIDTNNFVYCGYTGDVVAVAVDGNGKVIGYSNVIQAPVGVNFWSGIATQETDWTATIDVGQAKPARSLYIIQSLDSSATLQGVLGEAVSVGETIASVVSSL